MTTEQHSDVLIMGGGLAGLSLAIQLRRELPAATVRVLERNCHPVPEAAFKVGESTVEIGAHYFDSVLGLKQHLDECQIRKFGFRFFFNDGIDEVKALIEKARLDFTDVRYSNLAWLKQNGFTGLGRECLDEPADPSDPIEQVA